MAAGSTCCSRRTPERLRSRARLLLAQRTPFAFEIGRDGAVATRIADLSTRTGWRGSTFVARHDPSLKLFVIGQGEETDAVAMLALTYGAQAVVLTPDAALAATCIRRGAEAHVLQVQAPSPWLAADPWSAVLLLFHDHEWETQLLAQALDQEPFYIGAMGSPGTHARRLDALRALGVAEARLVRITGPVGLIPSTREPETLALSALAQIVSRYRRDPSDLA